MPFPQSDVLANITLAHCDAVGRGHPLHQLSAQSDTLSNPRTWFALLGIAAAAARLFVLLIAVLFLVVQRG